MSDLAALQHAFYAYLRGGPIAPMAAQVIAHGPAPTSVRLGIYANAYRKRLNAALEADHAMLGRYLGDALWERLCIDYIAAQPSRTRSLRWYGDGLPIFLARAEPFAQHPLLAELAAFERTLLDAFDAADADRLPWSALLALSPDEWPRLRLRFHPSVRRLASAWNAVPVWQTLKAERAPPAALAQPGVWLLWRDPQRITQFRAVPADEEAALRAMADDSVDFASACERLGDHLPPEQVPARALALLQQWLAAGLISARIDHAD